jgi:hypothetical protein
MNYPNPPIGEMMRSLYSLFERGLLKKSKIEDFLMNIYDIDEVIYDDERMSCIIYKNEDPEIKEITSILI